MQSDRESIREYFQLNKEDSENCAPTDRGRKGRRKNSSVRQMSISDTMGVSPTRNWKFTSQTGGEIKARNPIWSLLSANIIFKKHH